MHDNCKVIGGEVSERLQNMFFVDGFFDDINQLIKRVYSVDPALGRKLEDKVNLAIGQAAERGFVVGLRVAKDPALVLLVER